MLAGVTGVMCASSCRFITGLLADPHDAGEEPTAGGAGGGIDIDKSTGDGESLSANMLFLRHLDERSRGVDVADLTFRGGFRGATGAGGRGVTRFLLSSGIGDAVRLLGDLTCDGCC